MTFDNNKTNNKNVIKDTGNRRSIEEFCETTSAHGFNQLKNAYGQKLKLVFWHFIIILAFIFLTLHLSMLINKYLQYDYDETTILLTESPVFPDVTLCNMDPLNGAR